MKMDFRLKGSDGTDGASGQFDGSPKLIGSQAKCLVCDRLENEKKLNLFLKNKRKNFIIEKGGRYF